MSMGEKLVIVPRRNTPGKKLLNFAWFGLALLFMLVSFLMPIFFLVALLFAAVWYFQAFQSDIEYEYTYFDGEFRFAKIKAKRKRKNLGQVEMEDVIAIAPKGDRSVYKYETDKNMTCRKLTSGEPDAKIYELIYKGDKGFCRYEFEPDEEMLDAVIVKYPRMVIK